jgi:hypothetical protein
MKSNKERIKTVRELGEAIDSCSVALAAELESTDLAPNTAEDISARYWLMTFMEPLNRKEIKSICDGFLVQMLTEEQAKKIVKFLLARFPHYYKDYLQPSPPEPEEAPAPAPVAPVAPAPAAPAQPKLELPKELLPK